MTGTNLINHQIRTRWRDFTRTELVTELIRKPVPRLEHDDVLVEILFVPIHGSFWLASHPRALHPRIEEFMREQEFVFGNGGVGRVLAVADEDMDLVPGDYVAIMGHVPCQRTDCYSCRVLHRYVECDYGEGKILGHGNGAPDGTFGRYCVVPRIACEVCFRAADAPSEPDLFPYMIAFLLADVRNAMTRNPETLSKKRTLLLGAGYAGHLAAWLLLRSSPDAKILVLDVASDRLSAITRLAPHAVHTLHLDKESVENSREPYSRAGGHPEFAEVSDRIGEAIFATFGARGCDLVMDASSGNALPLWLSPKILRPGSHCIPFGFGSSDAWVTRELLQVSGLTIMMSRGVGNLENRRAAVELVREADDIIRKHLFVGTRRLNGMDEAIAFIREQQDPAKALNDVQRAYIAPNPHLFGSAARGKGDPASSWARDHASP